MDILCVAFEEQIQLAPIIGATIAAIVVVIGWFMVSFFNRKDAIVRELRDKRINMLNAIIDFRNSFVKYNEFNSEVQKLYDEAFLKLQLYGKNDEVEIFKNLQNALEELKVSQISKNYSENELHVELILLNNLKISIIKLSTLCQNRIREELKLEKLNAK
jgi:hypothetical protein